MYIVTYKYDGARILRDFNGKKVYTISVENGCRKFLTLESLNDFMDAEYSNKAKYRDIEVWDVRERLDPAPKTAESRWKRVKV